VTIAGVGLVLAAGCSSPASGSGSPGGAGGSSDTISSDGGNGLSGGSGGMSPGPTAALSGVVHDTSGAPLQGAAIQLCAEACYLAYTEPDGSFWYQSVPAGHYKLDLRGPARAEVNYGAVNFPLDLAPDDQQVLDAPLVLPVTGDGVPLTGGTQQIAIDSDLTLTIDADALELPPAVASPYLAGVRVVPSSYPPNQPPSGTVVAWWALNPFGTLSSQPIGVSIVNNLGLAAAAPLAIYTVSDQTGEMDLAAATQVSSDGTTIALNNGQGLAQISWVAVVEP